MRIISGKYRGMKLAVFDGTDIRPTADRVKESLFNILYDKISGGKVLDLFCGSGNLGMECISRGAAYVHFNDVSKESIAVLKSNLKRIKETNFAVTNMDYLSCLLSVKKFGVIFIDPPYKSDFGEKSLEIIGKNKLLETDGIAVFESDRSFTGKVHGLNKIDERKYGKTYINFFVSDMEE